MKTNKRKLFKKLLLGLAVLLVIDLLLPTTIENPVHPWGDHCHRGVDIFAHKGTNVHPAIAGIVVATAHDKGLGGNSILIMSSGMRFHYYAHLDQVNTHTGAVVNRNSVIGESWEHRQCH